MLTSFHQNALPTALLLRLAGVPRIAAVSRTIPATCSPPGWPTRPTARNRCGCAASPPPPASRLPPGDDGALAVRPSAAVVPGLPRSAVPRRAPGRRRARAHLPRRVLGGRGAVADRRRAPGGGDRHGRRAAGDGARWPPPPVRRGSWWTSPGAPTSPRWPPCCAAPPRCWSATPAPAHLAAAVGTPVVSLCRPVVPAPGGRRTACGGYCSATRTPAARAPAPGSCPVAGHPCLASVRPEEVVAAVDRLLATAGGCRLMRILLWHVHGSWTTAFVQGRHEYVLPVLPDRGPDGRGAGAHLGLAGHGGRGGAGALADEPVDLVVLQRPHEASWCGAGPAGVPASTCRRSTWSTTRRNRSPVASRHPMADRSGHPARARHALQPAVLGQRRRPHDRHRARRRRPRRRATPGSCRTPRSSSTSRCGADARSGTDLIGALAGGHAGRPVRHGRRPGAARPAHGRHAPGSTMHAELAPAAGLPAPDALDLARPVPDRGDAPRHAGRRGRGTEAAARGARRGRRRLLRHRRAARGGAPLRRRARRPRPPPARPPVPTRSSTTVWRASSPTGTGSSRRWADEDRHGVRARQPARRAGRRGRRRPERPRRRAAPRRSPPRGHEVVVYTRRDAPDLPPVVCRWPGRPWSTTSTPGRPAPVPKDELLPLRSGARPSALADRLAGRAPDVCTRTSG